MRILPTFMISFLPHLGCKNVIKSKWSNHSKAFFFKERWMCFATNKDPAYTYTPRTFVKKNSGEAKWEKFSREKPSIFCGFWQPFLNVNLHLMSSFFFRCKQNLASLPMHFDAFLIHISCYYWSNSYMHFLYMSKSFEFYKEMIINH